jgi:hypothetical protein
MESVMGIFNRLLIGGSKGLEEWSSNFDLEDVEPFLARVSSHVESGFGALQIQRLVKRIAAMKVESDRWFAFRVTHRGRRGKLKIYVFMEDIDAPGMALFAPDDLCREIAREGKSYFAGR